MINRANGTRGLIPSIARDVKQLPLEDVSANSADISFEPINLNDGLTVRVGSPLMTLAVIQLSCNYY